MGLCLGGCLFASLPLEYQLTFSCLVSLSISLLKTDRYSDSSTKLRGLYPPISDQKLLNRCWFLFCFLMAPTNFFSNLNCQTAYHFDLYFLELSLGFSRNLLFQKRHLPFPPQSFKYSVQYCFHQLIFSLYMNHSSIFSLTNLYIQYFQQTIGRLK